MYLMYLFQEKLSVKKVPLLLQTLEAKQNTLCLIYDHPVQTLRLNPNKSMLNYLF